MKNAQNLFSENKTTDFAWITLRFFHVDINYNCSRQINNEPVNITYRHIFWNTSLQRNRLYNISLLNIDTFETNSNRQQSW